MLAAADEYFEKTGRRVTYEYVLLGGVNDGLEHARQLVALLRGRPSLINVIPYNAVAGLPFRADGRGHGAIRGGAGGRGPDGSRSPPQGRGDRGGLRPVAPCRAAQPAHCSSI